MTEYFCAVNFIFGMLRRLCGTKRDEVTGELRKLQTEELNDLYSSSSIIGVIKSRRMLGGACSKYGGKQMCTQGLCWGNLRERDHLEDPGVDGKIILR